MIAAVRFDFTPQFIGGVLVISFVAGFGWSLGCDLAVALWYKISDALGARVEDRGL